MHACDHLNQFVFDDEGYAFTAEQEPGAYRLVSGLWRNAKWEHAVQVITPSTHKGADTAILYITGGDKNALDLEEAAKIAERSGLPVAMLFHIPNQPIFEMWEDDLIAHTFEQFIDTGDYSWPLLFPMTRAAIRAMDGLETLGYGRFIVTGASKRGWTTWLAAATGDPRIAGIAPMVIDNLNFPAQMAHQVASWGGYSEQIQDYTSRELQREMDSDLGSELTTMMDPVNYVDRIRCPILIINGANDRYWTVDSLSLYWDRLPKSTRCLIVPNVGHILGDKVHMIETLSAFANACAHHELLPSLHASILPDRIAIESESVPDVRIWCALSESLDFRDSEWMSSPAPSQLDYDSLTMNAAVMVEARHSGRTGEFSVSTPVKVLKARN